MSKIFWDTMLFVYWLEGHQEFGPRVEKIFRRMQERDDHLCTSTLAYGEVLVRPYKTQDREAADAIHRFFRGPLVEVLPFSAGAALQYASIRSRYAVSPPDAVHLACAADAGTDLFLTNDASLIGKDVPGIQFIAGLQTDLF